MLILVMRHGQAEEGRPDFDRNLTEVGRQQAARKAQQISEKSVVVQHLFASPRVRAHQTAEIVREGLSLHAVETWPELDSGAVPQTVARKIGSVSATSLIVSHQPFVSLFIEFLTGEGVRMGTSCVACVECEVPGPGAGELKWVLQD